MAKRRPAKPRSARKTSASGTTKVAEKKTFRPVKSRPAPAPPPEKPAPRPSYLEAIAHYERGVERLQHRDFEGARRAFQTVLDRFPEERELQERARLYVRLCDRETAGSAPAPRTVEERTYAATIALNSGAPDRAVAFLKAVVADEPGHDHAHYMLAVAYNLLQQKELSLSHLREAVTINPENRALARHDPDLDTLRAWNPTSFRELVEASGPASARRRARPRARL
jgi:tetratricopeptide (TPR) repeat protein